MEKKPQKTLTDDEDFTILDDMDDTSLLEFEG